MTTFHAIWTVALLIIFLGIIFWAWSSRRKGDFNEASMLPLEDDEPLSTELSDSDKDRDSNEARHV